MTYMSGKIFYIDFKLLKYNNDPEREQDCYIAAGYFLTEHCMRFRGLYSDNELAYRLVMQEPLNEMREQKLSFIESANQSVMSGIEEMSILSAPDKKESKTTTTSLQRSTPHKVPAKTSFKSSRAPRAS